MLLLLNPKLPRTVHSPCKCCEDNLKNHYQNVHGCDQCNDGTTRFKWNYQYYCENCEDRFGDACLFCQATNGCAQCESGCVYVEYCGKPNDRSCVHNNR